MSTLVTVAQRAKARFFRLDARTEPLEEIQDLAHPASRLHEGDLVTDSPGSQQERMGPQSRAMRPENSAKEHEAQTFAKEVAETLGKLRQQKGVHRLVLVAEPGFLGLLRKNLDGPTAKLVDAEIDKELTDLDAGALKERLKEVL